MSDSNDYEVAPARVFRQKYGPTAANRPTIRLDPSRVPEKFRVWIPLAERWGIGDDFIRDDCVYDACAEDLAELLAFGDAYDSILTEWLAGPDSYSPDPSKEYLAFSCLGMAWDLANAINRKRNV